LAEQFDDGHGVLRQSIGRIAGLALGQSHGHEQLVSQVMVDGRSIVQEGEQVGNSRLGHLVGRETLSAEAAKSGLATPQGYTGPGSGAPFAERPNVRLEACFQQQVVSAAGHAMRYVTWQICHRCQSMNHFVGIGLELNALQSGRRFNGHCH
jgi:hypothetical protein